MRLLRVVLLATLAAAARLPALEPPRVIEVPTSTAPVALAVDPTLGVLYALGSEGILTAVDELTLRRSLLAIPVAAFALAVDSETGRVYMSGLTPDLFGSRVTLLDPATGETTIAISGAYLGAPAVNSTTHRVYVTTPSGVPHTPFGYHSVIVFDGGTLAAHDVPITGARSVALGVDELHDRIYVATASDAFFSPTPVTIVDGETERAVDVETCFWSTAVAVDASRSRAWITCSAKPNVFLIDGDPLAGGARVFDFPLAGTPTHLAVNPTTGRLYVALRDRAALIEVDADRRLVREVPIAEPATGLAVNPATNGICAILASSGGVALVDGESHEVIEIPVGAGASAVVVDAVRDIAWISTAAGATGLYGPAAPCFHCTRVVDRP